MPISSIPTSSYFKLQAHPSPLPWILLGVSMNDRMECSCVCFAPETMLVVLLLLLSQTLTFSYFLESYVAATRTAIILLGEDDAVFHCSSNNC